MLLVTRYELHGDTKMVQHSDHNSHKRSQNEYNRINDDNSHTILSNHGKSLGARILETSPDGNHGTNCLFLLGTRNNNNNNSAVQWKGLVPIFQGNIFKSGTYTLFFQKLLC